MELNELLFFDRMPRMLPVYETLRNELAQRYPQMKITVGKTQISFRSRYIFAMASLPVRRIRGCPDEFLLVSFGLSRRLEDDLSRRDFTVNAMAFHPERGLVDCFGGKEDLKNRILKCVGEPERRFREDALRILRCLRFSSALEFAIEEDTRQALLKHRELLKKIAPERLQAEFSKLILGEWAEQVLTEFSRCFCRRRASAGVS